MGFLDQSLFTLTSLQEDPMLQQLEIEAQELHHAYDNVRGPMQTITTKINGKLAQMHDIYSLRQGVDLTMMQRIAHN